MTAMMIYTAESAQIQKKRTKRRKLIRKIPSYTKSALLRFVYEMGDSLYPIACITMVVGLWVICTGVAELLTGEFLLGLIFMGAGSVGTLTPLGLGIFLDKIEKRIIGERDFRSQIDEEPLPLPCPRCNTSQNLLAGENCSNCSAPLLALPPPHR